MYLGSGMSCQSVRQPLLRSPYPLLGEDDIQLEALLFDFLECKPSLCRGTNIRQKNSRRLPSRVAEDVRLGRHSYVNIIEDPSAPGTSKVKNGELGTVEPRLDGRPVASRERRPTYDSCVER